MTKIMNRITRTAMLAVAFMLCATGGAWADPYVTTGYEDFGSTAGVVLWRATQTTFHDSTVIDVAVDGTPGSAYAMDSNKGETSWQRFASTQTGYKSPGKVLVYDASGYTASSDAQFAPLSFGGLYVKVLQAEGTPYEIKDTKTDTSDRLVELGATGKSTLFKFEKSFKFNRNTPTEVKGTATVDIDSGATFTINARANKGAKVDSGNTLILKGSGTLAVTGGLSVGGTLDISNSPATIDGDVILSSGSTLVLPAGTEKDETISIPVCSGALTVNGTVNVKIGTDDAVSADIAVSGGTITSVITDTNLTRTYTTTVNGDANFSTLSWEKGGVTCDWASGASVSATISVSAASIITIDKAVTLNALTINNTSGGAVTLRVAGSSTLTAGSISIPANVTLEVANTTAITASTANISGAGNIAFASGTFTLNGNNSSLTGNIIVKNGAKIVAGSTNAFGSTGNSSATRRVIAESGGTIDINGKAMGLIYRIAGDGEGEGALINKVGGALGSGTAQMCGLELTGSASVNSTGYFGVIASGFNTGILDIPDGCTLTKYGSNDFYLCNINGGGKGKIVVSAGMLFFKQNPVSIPNVTIEVSGSTSYIGGNANLTAKKVKLVSGGTVHSSWTGFNIIADEFEVASGSTYSYPSANNRLTIGTLVVGGTVNWNAYALNSTDPTTVTIDGGTFKLFNGNGDTKDISSSITGTGDIIVYSEYTANMDATTIAFTGDTSGFTGTTTIQSGTLSLAAGGEGATVVLSTKEATVNNVTTTYYGKLKLSANDKQYSIGYKPNITRSSDDYNIVSYTHGGSAIAAEYIDGVNLLPQGPTIECVASSTVDFGTVGSWTKYSGESAPSSGCIVIQAATSATLNIDETATFDAILIRGSGAVTLAGTGSLTTRELIIDDAVTLNVNSNGIVLSTDGTISGTGTLNVPNGISYALDGVDCSVAITAGTNSTLSFKDSTINGGVSAPQDGNVTINTYGTVSFGSSANNDFQYSTTLNVESGTTTYNSKDDTKLWCIINVKSGATLVNARSDGFNWGADTGYPIHAHIWGTLTLNAKWTIGAGNYIHLYDGALINGTVSNALHFNTGCGHIVAENGDSIITAPFVKGAGTIAVEVKSGATLSTTSEPEISSKTGSGKLFRVYDNERWTSGSVRANYDGVELCYTGTRDDNNHSMTFVGSDFEGILKVSDDGTAFAGFALCDELSTPVFNNRPTLIAAGGIGIYRSNSSYPFTVSNLCGSGYFCNYYGSTSVYKYIETLQSEDTTYSGVFQVYASNNDDSPALTVRGEDEGDLHSLTLTGASDTTGPLTITNNAKVVFSSSGSWSGGTVAVCKDGVLESQNSAAIAATLKVQKGATLVFTNGVQLVATAYDWTDVTGAASLTDAEKIKVDLSNVIPASEVILIAAVGDANLTADMFTIASSMYSTYVTPTLVIDNGALKVCYSGNLCVDGTWLVGPTANQAATIALTQDSTLTVSSDLSLGAVTIMKATDDNVAFTITGAGALAVTSLTIPAGVTVYTPASFAASSVSGQGTINIPVDTIATISGICTARVVVNGTLKASGTAMFTNSNNYIAAGGLLDVLSGTTTFKAPYTRQSAGDQCSQGICGNITVEYGAVFNIAGNSGSAFNNLDPYGTSVLDISGTLNMGNLQWQMNTGITINLREGATINGNNAAASEGYGDWESLSGGNTIHVYGDATIAASIKPTGGITFDVAQDATLTITGPIIGDSASLIKSGVGAMDLTSDTIAKPLTINGGKVVGAAVPTANVTINENGTFTLQNAAYTSDVFSGTGTLELLKTTSGDLSHTVTSTFGGKIKVVRNINSNHHIFGSGDTDSTCGAIILTGQPELEISGDYPYLCLNRQLVGNYIDVKNLSLTGGTIDPVYNASTKGPKGIRTLQTNDTVVAGNLSGESDASNRNVALYVYGQNATVHSLTLSAANSSYGSLTVENYGKVIFSGSGSWNNGSATVGTNGVLESQRDAQVVGALTLEAGATLSFVDGCPLQFGSISWPEEGKVSVDVFGMTLDSSGTTLMTFGDEETAASALSKLTCDHAILAVSGSSVLAKPAAGSVTLLSGETTLYAQMNRVLGYAAMYAANGTLDYITIIASDPITIDKYADIMRVRNIGSADITIGSLGSAGEYLLDTTTVDGMTTYTVTKNPTTYIWTDKFMKWENPNHEWLYSGNWGVAEVDAVRYPVSGDSIVVDRDVSSTIEADPSVSGEFNKIVIGSELTLCRSSGSSGTVTISATNGIVLTNSVATLTIDSNVDLDTDVTTDVEGKVVAWTYGDNTITYYVADPVAEIGGVQYGSLANAFESASTTVTNTVTLLANCSEMAVTLSGKTVAFDKGSYSFAGSLTGNGTIIVSNATTGNAWAKAMFAEGWTGTFVMGWTVQPQDNNTQWILDNYGISNSTVEVVNDISAGYFKGLTTYAPSVAPAVYFNGDVIISNGFKGDSQVTTFSCAGMKDGKTFNTRGNGNDHTYFKFTVLENFDGTINVKGCDHLTIGTIVVDETPDYNTCLVKITKSANATLADLADVQVKVGDSAPVTMPLVFATKGGVSGLYLATAKVGSDTYGSLDAAITAAGESGTVTLVADTSADANLPSGVTLEIGSCSYTGTLYGSGTVVYTSAPESVTLDEGWTGTVELKDITTVITDFDFADYGNANSTVRVDNVCVRPADASAEIGGVKEINIAAGGLVFGTLAPADAGNTAINEKTITLSAKLTGSGALKIGIPGGDGSHTTKSNATKYVFKGDFSEFRGAVNFNDLGSYKAVIVFQGTNDQEELDAIPAVVDWGSIIITENAALTSSGEVYAPGNLRLDGVLETTSTGTVKTDGNGQKMTGSGYLKLGQVQTGFSINDSWTGFVELPSFAATGQNLNNYGVTGSTVVLGGITGGYIAPGGSVVNPNLQLNGDVNITAMSARAYQFATISGTGSLSFASGGEKPTSITIAKIAPGYTGTISNSTADTLTVGEVDFAPETVFSHNYKVLSIGGDKSDVITITNLKIGTGEPFSPPPLKSKSDGIYIWRGTIFSVY